MHLRHVELDPLEEKDYQPKKAIEKVSKIKIHQSRTGKLISKNPYQNVFIYDAPTKTIDEVKEDQEESWSYYSEAEED